MPFPWQVREEIRNAEPSLLEFLEKELPRLIFNAISEYLEHPFACVVRKICSNRIAKGLDVKDYY